MFHRGINKYPPECECRMERIAHVWGRWKRVDIEVRSKDALTEKENQG